MLPRWEFYLVYLVDRTSITQWEFFELTFQIVSVDKYFKIEIFNFSFTDVHFIFCVYVAYFGHYRVHKIVILASKPNLRSDNKTFNDRLLK